MMFVQQWRCDSFGVFIVLGFVDTSSRLAAKVWQTLSSNVYVEFWKILDRLFQQLVLGSSFMDPA